MSVGHRVASLPMYDINRATVDAWWDGIARSMRRHGVSDVPHRLTWPSDLDTHWRDSHLLISQTCGYPLVNRLAGRLQVVGVFRYTAPGCVGIHYRSELVVRRKAVYRTIEDFRGGVAAVNALDSFSGCHALRALVAPLARCEGFFSREVESGSHRASLELVRDGQADIAAIDCISLAGMRRVAPDLHRDLQCIGATALAPGLPLVTSAETSADDLQAVRRALSDVIEDPALAEIRRALFIGGFEVVPVATWKRMAPIALLPDEVAPSHG